MLAPTLGPTLASEDSMAYGPTPDPKLIAELTAALRDLALLRERRADLDKLALNLPLLFSL